MEITRLLLVLTSLVDVAFEIFVYRIDEYGDWTPDLTVIRHQGGEVVRAARLLKLAVRVDQPLQRIERRHRVG
jgi:hypothetical protein